MHQTFLWGGFGHTCALESAVSASRAPLGAMLWNLRVITMITHREFSGFMLSRHHIKLKYLKVKYGNNLPLLLGVCFFAAIFLPDSPRPAWKRALCATSANNLKGIAHIIGKSEADKISKLIDGWVCFYHDWATSKSPKHNNNNFKHGAVRTTHCFYSAVRSCLCHIPFCSSQELHNKPGDSKSNFLVTWLLQENSSYKKFLTCILFKAYHAHVSTFASGRRVCDRVGHSHLGRRGSWPIDMLHTCPATNVSFDLHRGDGN